MRRAPKPEGRPTPTASRRSTLASAWRLCQQRERRWRRAAATGTGVLESFAVTYKTVNTALLRCGLGLLVLVAACAPTPTAKLPVTCGAITGGHPGAETQLRFVEASDTEIVLTFGASSASNVFDVPAFELTPLEGAGSPRAYRLKVNGTSTLNPDGTASYRGLKGLEPGGRTVRAIDLIDESARVVTFTVALERDVCPFVAAKVYTYGKSPRAQIALTFGGASALTLETISDAVGGAPIGTPVQGSGAGYEPSSQIRITIGGRLVWETTANTDGTFDSGFWIPDREPGLYAVTATDGHGHVGTTTLRVMAQRTKK